MLFYTFFGLNNRDIKRNENENCENKKMAGVAGIEPALTVLETAALPLYYTPMRSIIIA